MWMRRLLEYALKVNLEKTSFRIMSKSIVRTIAINDIHLNIESWTMDR